MSNGGDRATTRERGYGAAHQRRRRRRRRSELSDRTLDLRHRAGRRGRAAAGIRPGRLHDVRHTHATHLLTRGVPVHVVAARLGHASPVTTMRVYAHVLPKSDDQAAGVIAAVLRA